MSYNQGSSLLSSSWNEFFSDEILRITFCMTKRGFVIVILKLVRDQRIYMLRGWLYIECRSLCAILVGCPLYQGVCWHWYSIQVGVGYTALNSDHWRSTLLSKSRLAKGYGYMCPLDLRLPRWLVSNSLYFGAGPARHCDLVRKVSGCSQVLTKSVRESRWELTPPIVGVNGSLYINLAKPWPR